MKYDFGITVRFEEEKYRAAERILTDRGYTMPEAFRMFINAVAASGNLPFTLQEVHEGVGRKVEIKK